MIPFVDGIHRAYVWGLLIAHGVSAGQAWILVRAYCDWTMADALPIRVPGRPRKVA